MTVGKSHTVGELLEGLQAVIDGTADVTSEAIEEAKEPGLNHNQRAVAEKYVGEGIVQVESSRIPNLGDKIVAQAELPWSFVLDGVEFIVKARGGSKRNEDRTQWPWSEDGYRFEFIKYCSKGNEVRISRSVDTGRDHDV